jgi:hypothetical protein
MNYCSTLARKGPVRAMNLREIRVFLYFSVLTFTWRTSRHNALARVSKSRIGDSRSDLSCRDRAYRIQRIIHQAAWLGWNQLSWNFKRGSARRLADAKFPCQLKQAVPFRGIYGHSLRAIVLLRPLSNCLKALLLCPLSGIANPECGRSYIYRPPAFSRNPFILSPFPCETHWHSDWLSAG